MDKMNQLSFSFFDQYSEAVVIAQSGDIVYLNAAARTLLSADIAAAKTSDIFPSLLIEDSTAMCSGIVTLNGSELPVTAASMGEYRVFTIYPMQKDASGEVSSLLSSVSGAMRSPLSIMKMSASLVLPDLASFEDRSSQKYASMLLHSYYSLVKLVDDLQNYASATDEIFSISAFDIVSAYSDLLSSVAHTTAHLGIDISLDTPEERLVVSGDRKKLELMLLKLLSNSLRHTPQGGKITVSVHHMPTGNVRITVRDTGTGIPSEHMSRVFSKFEADTAPTGDDPGLGLGLIIVQHIARQHGGSAVLESSENGTSVSIMMPIVSRNQNKLRSDITPYAPAGMDPILIELSDVLDHTAYTLPYMD